MGKTHSGVIEEIAKLKIENTRLERWVGEQAFFFRDRIFVSEGNLKWSGRGYQPDIIFYEKNKNILIIIEVENIASPAKPIQDMIFSYLINKLDKKHIKKKTMLIICADAPEYAKTWCKLVKDGFENDKGLQYYPVEFVNFKKEGYLLEIKKAIVEFLK